MEIFFNSVENNDLIKIKELISEEVNINQVNKNGYSALHIASFKGLNEMALLLLESGIDPNIKDNNGQTILHYAALNNQVEVAKKALSRGANLSIEDIHGNQPLWTAVFNDKGRNDRIEIIKLFLEHSADVNHKNKVGKSPKDIVTIAGYHNLKNIIV